jgi:cellobiose phosphorylase
MSSYTTEKLRGKARELALQHSVGKTRSRLKQLRGTFEENIQSLRDFVSLLQESPASCAQPAEEWLLDNAEFIEEQALEVRLQLSGRSPDSLPCLRKEGKLRIQSICEDYLEQVDGLVEEDTLVAYIEAYQEVSALTLAEARAIPLVLRVALIGRLAHAMSFVRERREVCMEVDRLLSRLAPSRLDPDTIHAELDAAGLEVPLPGPWVAHLISHLREWADDSATVRQWLLCKFENGAEDLDRIVAYEHQLQASLQVTAGNLISRLRKNERRDWNDLFERISLPDRTLRGECTGVYPKLDAASRSEILRHVETTARRLRVPETLIAATCVELAKEEMERAEEQAPGGASRGAGRHEAGAGGPAAGEDRLPRAAFAAYYLYDPAGIRRLTRALHACSKPRRRPGASLLRGSRTYFAWLIGLFGLLLAGSAAWIGGGAYLSLAGWAAILLAAALPVSEWAVTWFHFAIERCCRPRPLLRYDYSSGIPPEAATMVVIPAIWSSPEEVAELADRLEIHYLGNRDPHIHYALLGDFTDADRERLPEDEAVLACARERIEALNRKYSVPGGTTFHFYQRRRQWNPGEGVYMGWERKRGKLVEFVELLRGSTETSYDYRIGDASVLPGIRYVITLDADTQLPMGSAQRMIGTIHLPYNRPRLNPERTRVVEGYGVLQPRIGISHESAMRSRLAYFWSDPGFDPYAFAASDPYQDALETGIFTGKGIFDVEAFAETLCERIPENAVLSHDLLEGGFLRAGLLSDIELIDDHPSKFITYQKRLHRWVRGDWQLLCWLYPRVCDRKGALKPVDLSAVTRWQVIDNLRRSLVPVAYYAALLLGLTVLPGSPWRWLALISASLLLPLIRQLVSIGRAGWHVRGLGSAAVHVLIGAWTLPFQTAVLLDAVGRTLYRLWISKRRLLEWTSSSHIERGSRGGRQPALLGTRGGYVLIVLFAAAVVLLQPLPALRWAGGILALFWALAPLAIRWLDQPVAREEELLSPADKEELRKLAGQIWSFYDRYAGAEDHYLPPDNVQLDPPRGVARRTSPTNIGFLLTSVLAAREFGFIGTPEMVGRIERTVETVERLEKWNGHLYNWYDTSTLAVLPPAYVSTVDSGNFVASLMTVKQGLEHWLLADSAEDRPPESRLEAAGREEFAVELGRTRPGESALGAPGEEGPGNRSLAQAAPRDWRERGRHLLDRLEALIAATDFRKLYDHKAKLFVLGYHVAAGEADSVLYDLLASEARQTSFVAIALGQVSVAHWMALGRTVNRQGKHTTLISWSGTQFEYLMPWLILRTYKNTIWDSTYRGVVRRQIEYARQRGVPFGISESGYYAFDYQMNYQYRAFGVPGLGFKRGLEQDLVLAPYATIMALPFAPGEGLEDLRRMEQLGARGEYGFYEAIDFTPVRMPEGRTHMVIRSFMAHHQGMSLLTLANLLLPRKMYDYFHRDKRVQAAELLLKERIPARETIRSRELPAVSRGAGIKPARNVPLREFAHPRTPVPEVNVLSNGSFTSMVTTSGSGFLRYDGLEVSRWREDPVADPWGSYMYIRDAARDKLWSPTFQPCRTPADRQRIEFSPEKSVFRREDGDVRTTLEICVSPEANAEIRRLTLENTGGETRLLEVTTFLELSLAPHEADKAHPAFSKLFVETEFDAGTESLLARKRPRDGGEEALWAFHTLTSGDEPLGAAEYETDRARFIGRGHTLANPRGIASRLHGTVGAVADPAFVMRRRVTLEPGGRVRLIAVTGVAGTREQAAELLRQLAGGTRAERTFQLAWTRSRIEQQHLHLTPADMAVFQGLAGRVLYAAPLRPERRSRIAANTRGQQGLWAHGVSGDRPVVMVRIGDTAGLSFVNKVLQGYEYLRRRGLFFDLILLNESAGGYQQDLQEALRRSVERMTGSGRPGEGGVSIVNAASLSGEEMVLFEAVSRLVLRADGPSLRAQLRVPSEADDAASAPIPAPAWTGPEADPPPAQTDEERLLFFNGWGGFTPDGREYQILLRSGSRLPAPWINVLANPQFGCLASEMNTGYSWWRNSRECKLTPWSNDPVLDPPGEVCYLRDEESGDYWPLAPARSQEGPSFRAAHGRGYTRYEMECRGLRQEMTVFVPQDDPVKVVRLRVRNDTPERRTLSVTYYAEWVLGVHREGNASFVVTEWDEENRMLTARNTYQEHFRDAVAFLAVSPGDQAGSGGDRVQDPDDPSSLSWTADRREFLGRDGTFEHPAALRRERLSNTDGPLYDSCGALQMRMTLGPGEEKTVFVLLGCGDSRGRAAQLARKYRDAGACEQALQEVQAFWDRVLGAVTVSTPHPEMDLLLNHWLLYQTLACRMWARTAFYQAGGAYGFRDQLQDSLALLHSRPDLTRAQILLHAAHQYEEGDVQHWWHEETERGIRTRFSDDLLWLPYAVARYVEHTGDESVLDETVPYLTSDPLGEDEYERYEETVVSGERGTVFEHCLRAVDRSLQTGEHGLPLIGIGDWNDGMSRVGAEGRGESVWLGWFLGEILEHMAGLCERRGDSKRAGDYRNVRGRLAAALDQYGWDGQWYRRAFTDAGTWLGSVRGEECRIDAIAQSWSVLSGMGAPEKQRQAMNSFDRELVDRSLSVAHILYPPFNHTDPSPGYIQGYPPGIRENGGQYTHGVIWSIIAWCALGEGDKAFELFRLLNPIHHARTPAEVRRYAAEPYIMAADIYTGEPHRGHAGWTWYTGAAGWMYQAGLEWILGLRRRGNRLFIRPCIPRAWPEFSAAYRFGGTEYRITVRNPSGRSEGASSLQMDGREVDLNEYSTEEGPFVRLSDDGMPHRIVLTL